MKSSLLLCIARVRHIEEHWRHKAGGSILYLAVQSSPWHPTPYAEREVPGCRYYLFHAHVVVRKSIANVIIEGVRGTPFRTWHIREAKDPMPRADHLSYLSVPELCATPVSSIDLTCQLIRIGTRELAGRKAVHGGYTLVVEMALE